MTSESDAFNGTALAAMELLKIFVINQVIAGNMSRAKALELCDYTLQSLEGQQMQANDDLKNVFLAARVQIEAVVALIKQIPKDA